MGYCRRSKTRFSRTALADVTQAISISMMKGDPGDIKVASPFRIDSTVSRADCVRAVGSRLKSSMSLATLETGVVV